jgi:hypothetical protein
MTCRECVDLMLEVVRGRAAPFVERTVAAHAAGCADCARRLETQRSLTAGLRAVAAADAVRASADLEGRMAAAFAALQTDRALSGAPHRSKRWRPVAAGLILAAGLTAWWTIDSAPDTSQLTGKQTAATLPAPLRQSPGGGASAPEAPGAIRRSGTAPPATTRATTARNRRSAAAVRPTPNPQPVQPAGFTAIPSAAGLPEFESGEIVRLDVPVTSLPNYGVEMPADAPSSSIQADLLVGQDGQPRAIRLVTASNEDLRPRR